MDVSVLTGQTRTARGISLVSLSLPSSLGETVSLLMEVHGKEKDSQTIERECQDVITRSLLETEGPAGQRLDGALKELNGLLKGLQLAGKADEMHVIISVLEQSGMLHVSHAGRAEAYLIRQGVASQITEYTGGKPVPAFVHISSGQAETRDVVILSTQRLLRTLTPAQLSKATLRHEEILPSLIRSLESDDQIAALCVYNFPSANGGGEDEGEIVEDKKAPLRSLAARSRSARGNRGGRLSSLSLPAMPSMPSMPSFEAFGSIGTTVGKWFKGVKMPSMPSVPTGAIGRSRKLIEGFLADLTHPKRKKRAHLLLLAGAVASLVIVWAGVQAFTSTQRSKTKAELEALVAQIEVGIKTAENRHIIGDDDSANAILQQAEERAKQVMDNESGLFRVEALDLLERIRSKEEEINRVTRITSPRVVANLTSKSPNVSAAGLIGLSDGEFLAYDQHDFYRILLNSIDSPVKIAETDSVVDAVSFPRYQSVAFLTSGNNLVEWVDGEAVSMKTDDTAGWVTGTDLETYNRNLYVLSPDTGKIHKYERQTNRYSAPVQYNVNGDLTGALDMAIDGNVYVLKDGGQLLKFYRGETQQFVIRNLPTDALKDATRIFKQQKNFYFLDPVNSRVIVTSAESNTGESTYVNQYILEGDQIGQLQDLYVDAEDTRLYVIDEKRLYIIDLSAQ